MTTQTPPALAAWVRLVRAHAEIVREVNAELRSAHGLTLNELEVLLLLSRADEHSLRRVDLAEQILLSPSGITRMLDRLGNEGLVDKASCATDARVTYAVLTDAGMEKLLQAHAVHKAVIERLLGGELSTEELETLHGLLDRLPGEDDECAVGE